MLSLLITASMLVPDPRPVYHYERTNLDGTEEESIYVFVEARDRFAVMKQKSRCTNAAFVTARVDPETGQTQALIGGRLAPDSTQEPFAWLTTDAKGTSLAVRLGAPDAKPSYEIAIGSRWHLYDFDFADMIARPPAEALALRDFYFDLPLVLNRDDGFDFRNLGQVHLKDPVRTRHFGKRAIRYRVSGAAGVGSMWFDARSGVVVEARLPLANHREYRDFRLRLIHTDYGGEAAWKSVLAAHWRGCPATD